MGSESEGGITLIMNQPRNKANLGWPVRLVLLSLVVMFIGLGGPDVWRTLLSPKGLITTLAVVAFVLGWTFFR